MNKLRRIKYNKYAGVKINGTIPVIVDQDGDGAESNIEKALWITAMVESGGMFGSVMNYDGTGITAGLHQATAVYPYLKGMPQGMLWKLLDKIGKSIIPWGDEDSAAFHYIELIEALCKNGYFPRDGMLMKSENNGWSSVATGRDIRLLLSGSYDGCMPLKGEHRERAEKFVQLFHNLFSHEETFEAQSEFGMEHFENILQRKIKSQAVSINSFFDYHSHEYTKDYAYSHDIATSLAMSLFLSHSVNAPSMAHKVLQRVVADIVRADISSPTERARMLICALGNTRYGRWDDDHKNSRYVKTRKFAMKVYPRDLFVGKNAVMPLDLKG